MEHFKEVDETVDMTPKKAEKPKTAPKKRGRKKGYKVVERDEDGFRKPILRQKNGKEEIMVQENVSLLSGAVADVFTKGGHSWWRDPENGSIRSLRKYENADQLICQIEEWEQLMFDKVNAGEEIIPDAEALAAYLDVSYQTLKKWQRGEMGADYQEIIGIEMNKIAAVKNQLAMKGAIPQLVWATMMNNAHGYTQNSKMEVDITARREPQSAEKLIKEVNLLP